MAEDGINIEIAARTKPVIDMLDSKFTQDKKTILVDKRFWRKDNVEGNHNYAYAIAQALPFAEGIADLLVEKDMFCAQGFSTSKPDWHVVTEEVGDFDAIAREWFRVAKPGASVILIENATPDDGLLNKKT